MKKTGILRGVCAALFLGPPGASALEFIPVYNVGLSGGQYFFRGERASLNGNASVVAAPVLKAGEAWSFIPMYAGNYQGVKGVGEGVGAGTLFQQHMDHPVSFAAIHAPADSPWRLKPSASYKREFLKETRDEAWGKGLFDYQKLGLGLEAENLYRDPFSYRLGFDFYMIRFPNYDSLESSAGVDPSGNPLGRELASRKVLDTYNFQLSASGSRPFPYEDPKVSLQASYSLTYVYFADQRLVNSKGQYNDHKPYGRQDFLNTLGLSVAYPRPLDLFGHSTRLTSVFGVNLAYNGSNQNTFDASRTQFVSDAYSYASYGLGPSFSLAWGEAKRPTAVGVSLRYNRLQYLGRLSQQGEGVYTADHQYQDRTHLNLSYSYPISPGFYLKAQTNFLWVRSNQKYEKTYAYNYTTANYVMGFAWEY